MPNLWLAPAGVQVAPKAGPVTIRADLEALANAEHLTVAHLTDAQIESVAADVVAEFGERAPTPPELASVLFRYRHGAAHHTPEPRPICITLVQALEFEMATPRDTPQRDRLIRERFGVRPATFELALLRAMDDPSCVRLHPAATARLRRVRDRRRALRQGATEVRDGGAGMDSGLGVVQPSRREGLGARASNHLHAPTSSEVAT